VTAWTPEAGDLIWVDLSPTAGTEQTGRRTALVVSGSYFNGLMGRAVVLPITSKARGFQFEVALGHDEDISGVVLPDQIRTIDWRARYAKPAGKVSSDVLDDARAKLAALIGL
jgi:mRNA interferase MazF